MKIEAKIRKAAIRSIFWQHWTVEDWRRVIFSDETKINRLGSDGTKRLIHEEYSSGALSTNRPIQQLLMVCHSDEN
ncbi:uncharacterized protein BX664DRAFT_387161 [Halteromyces radiatus]|uniref:uncharacterized protein n=1 Tax=Halteromyces radiatus TaxID=101107 RepID=UPI00221EF89C|nr:uncharacterized protein BX664DRAFT_387161 [Halteromyces radiatus]KAI8086797.1 hypothetical protein BX664DRAFT_387161 [Halteromyces radiatus]